MRLDSVQAEEAAQHLAGAGLTLTTSCRVAGEAAVFLAEVEKFPFLQGLRFIVVRAALRKAVAVLEGLQVAFCKDLPSGGAMFTNKPQT